MKKRLGERLVGTRRITEAQLRRGLERQRLNGGRLGENLVALDVVRERDLQDFFEHVPAPPRTAEESGLNETFIADLILKHAVHMEEFRIPEIAERVKLPVSLVDRSIDDLRRERLVEVKGAGQISRLSYILAVSNIGRKRAADLMSISRYVGPAPVPFSDYRRAVEMQTVKSALVIERNVIEALSPLTLSGSLLDRLGPAISSGKAIFLYGPSGNGKTLIAETIGRILPGKIYLPHALMVGNEIITVYDRVNHRAAEPERSVDEVDQRWILIHRPVVTVGGEMTLKSLDLDFNPIAKFYEAPLQMKANNGLFIVDDFGRQQVDPQHLLNRWIVPLERRTDFLTLHTGMKIKIPFDQLVVFSTNIPPKDLVDEAFLRRIHYKIKIDHPTLDEYRTIFMNVCKANELKFDSEVFDHLIKHYYQRLGISMNACHPRDLIDHVIDVALYREQSPVLTKESLATAWENYFVEL